MMTMIEMPNSHVQTKEPGESVLSCSDNLTLVCWAGVETNEQAPRDTGEAETPRMTTIGGNNDG